MFADLFSKLPVEKLYTQKHFFTPIDTFTKYARDFLKQEWKTEKQIE